MTSSYKLMITTIIDKNFEIRTMSVVEMQITIEWADKEGWNPGLND